MPRQLTRKQNLNTFAGGLITEANPLASPDSSILSGDNVDVLRDGSAKRRRGIDLEAGGAFSSKAFPETFFSTAAITSHEWKAVDNRDDLNFQVTQVGNALYFHKLGEDPISGNEVGAIDLTPISTAEDFYREPIHADAGRGKLFIVGRKISPAYIQYDLASNEFTGVKLTLQVRDVDGIDEEESPAIFNESDITPPPSSELPNPEDTGSDVTGSVDSDGTFDISVPFIDIQIGDPF